MRLAIASDLHFEFHQDVGTTLTAQLPVADVFICAGDLCSSSELQESVEKICDRYEHVVYTMGNHEAYGSSLKAVRRRLDALAVRINNFHYLHDSTCEIAGQRFVGSTMWFRRVPGIELLHKTMNDFSVIKDANPWVYGENVKATEFLEHVVTNTDIVVTHHLPSMQSVHAMYKDSPTNCFFVCEMDDLIHRAQPKLWVHGHTHSSVDTMVGATRLLCNPFGYAGHALNPEWSENLVVEVD